MCPSSDMNLLRLPSSLLAGMFLVVSIFVSGCNLMSLFKNTEPGEEAPAPIVFIEEGDFMYLAEVVDPYTDEDAEVHVSILNAGIQEKLGDRVRRNRVLATRMEPTEGWGTRQVSLEYHVDGNWLYTEEATEFEDYYLVPVDEEASLKIEFKDVRFPIPLPH